MYGCLCVLFLMPTPSLFIIACIENICLHDWPGCMIWLLARIHVYMWVRHINFDRLQLCVRMNNFGVIPEDFVPSKTMLLLSSKMLARAKVLCSWIKGAIIVWGLLNMLMCWNSHLWSASTVQVYYFNLIGECDWVNVFKSSADQVEQTQFNWVGKCCSAFL